MARTAWVITCIWLGGVALGAGACRSFNTYCTELEDCVGGNEADIEACEVEAHAQEDKADAYGCGSEFGDYADCLEAESSCDSDTDQFGLEDPDDCEEEATAYNHCIGN